MSYSWLTESELLRVAGASDNELVRELAVRFERLIVDREELFADHEILRCQFFLVAEAYRNKRPYPTIFGDYPNTRPHLSVVPRLDDGERA